MYALTGEAISPTDASQETNAAASHAAPASTFAGARGGTGAPRSAPGPLGSARPWHTCRRSSGRRAAPRRRVRSMRRSRIGRRHRPPPPGGQRILANRWRRLTRRCRWELAGRVSGVTAIAPVPVRVGTAIARVPGDDLADRAVVAPGPHRVADRLGGAETKVVRVAAHVPVDSEILGATLHHQARIVRTRDGSIARLGREKGVDRQGRQPCLHPFDVQIRSISVAPASYCPPPATTTAAARGAPPSAASSNIAASAAPDDPSRAPCLTRRPYVGSLRAAIPQKSGATTVPHFRRCVKDLEIRMTRIGSRGTRPCAAPTGTDVPPVGSSTRRTACDPPAARSAGPCRTCRSGSRPRVAARTRGPGHACNTW